MTGARAQALEGYWLDGSAFVGGHEVSIADLLITTELEMLRLLAASPEARHGPAAAAGRRMPVPTSRQRPLARARSQERSSGAAQHAVQLVSDNYGLRRTPATHPRPQSARVLAGTRAAGSRPSAAHPPWRLALA